MHRIYLALVVLLLAGCDTLFPEFSQPAPDLGGTIVDGGATIVPHISGQICALSDARDYRSCLAAAGKTFRVTIEETRDVAMTDANGVFTINTSRPLTVATFAAVDPANNFVTTITTLHLANGILDLIAIPVLPTSAQTEMSNVNGIPIDPTRGAFLVYTVDATGLPVAGVTTAQLTLAAGPYYDGPATGELTLGGGTRTHGLIALFDLPAGALTITLPPPAPFQADNYELPIRSNALTITALPLH